MKTSQSIKNLMVAIQKVQQAVPPLKREALGSTGNRSYKYTTLDKVWEAASQSLKSNDLVVTQSPTSGESNIGEFFETVIYHLPSEEWISQTMMMRTAKDDPQGVGSAITYYRRYMLVSMLGLIVQGDDTDAAEHKLATAQQKAKIIGAVKQIFPEVDKQADIISTIQNIVGKHPSYIREDEAEDALKLIMAFTAKEIGDQDEVEEPKKD